MDSVSGIRWDQYRIESSEKGLYLVDEKNVLVIDMKREGQYTFSLDGFKDFKILYGDHTFLENHAYPDLIQVGAPYPNPAVEKLFIPVAIPDNRSSADITINVVNTMGQKVYEKKLTVPPGFGALEIESSSWDPGAGYVGIYLLKINVSSKDESKVFTYKVVTQ